MYALTVLEGRTTPRGVQERSQFRFFGVRVPHLADLIGGWRHMIFQVVVRVKSELHGDKLPPAVGVWDPQPSKKIMG